LSSMLDESFSEKIAARKVSLGLVLGTLIIAGFIAFTLILQFWFKWIDLAQNLTDLWIWILYVAFGAGYTLINVSLWRSRKQKISDSAAPSSPETALNELAITQLMGLAHGGLVDALKANLRIIGTDLDIHCRTRLVAWTRVDANLRQRLITDSEEYDALDDLSKSLERRYQSFDTPAFEMWDNLCKGHYERLKRMGFV